MTRHAGAVRQHVAQRHVAVELVVVKLDFRHGVAYRLVPGQVSFVHQHPRCHRREQLRVRRNRLHRFRREPQLLLIIPIAIALRKNQLVLNNYPDTHARRVPVFQRLFHVRVETLQLFRDVRFLRSRTNAKSHQRKDKQGDASRIRNAPEIKPAFTNHEDTPVQVSRRDFAPAFYCLTPIWQGNPTAPFFIMDGHSKNGGLDVDGSDRS